MALSPASARAGSWGRGLPAAHHRAVGVQAGAGLDEGVAVADLCAVGAGELDPPLRRSHLLAAGAGVLQSSHFGRITEERVEPCVKIKVTQKIILYTYT